jgi:uncharacterized protein YkvS
VGKIREGDRIELKDGRKGIVHFINNKGKFYQVIFKDDYHELIPFDQVKEKAAS